MSKGFSISGVLPPATAGIVAVLVGYTGAAIIVVQSFEAAGASSAVVGSWMTMLGWSMAASTLGLSLWYRQPLLTAWSTPGAALLVVGLHGHSLGEAVAAFMFCGALTLDMRRNRRVRAADGAHTTFIGVGDAGRCLAGIRAWRVHDRQ